MVEVLSETSETPTREEIRRMCWKIQEEWSPWERLRRAGKVESHWEPPVVRRCR